MTDNSTTVKPITTPEALREAALKAHADYLADCDVKAAEKAAEQQRKSEEQRIEAAWRIAGGLKAAGIEIEFDAGDLIKNGGNYCLGLMPGVFAWADSQGSIRLILGTSYNAANLNGPTGLRDLGAYLYDVDHPEDDDEPEPDPVYEAWEAEHDERLPEPPAPVVIHALGGSGLIFEPSYGGLRMTVFGYVDGSCSRHALNAGQTRLFAEALNTSEPKGIFYSELTVLLEGNTLRLFHFDNADNDTLGRAIDLRLEDPALTGLREALAKWRAYFDALSDWKQEEYRPDMDDDELPF